MNTKIESEVHATWFKYPYFMSFILLILKLILKIMW
jgi:hypothetical protein